MLHYPSLEQGPRRIYNARRNRNAFRTEAWEHTTPAVRAECKSIANHIYMAMEACSGDEFQAAEHAACALNPLLPYLDLLDMTMFVSRRISEWLNPELDETYDG